MNRPLPLVLALAALPFVFSGCGVGAVGAAAGVSGGGSGGTAQEEPVLLRMQSMPQLSAAMPAIPLEPNPGDLDESLAEPSETLTLVYSQPIDQTLSGASIEVELMRPPLGQSVAVSIESIEAASRSISIQLAGSTLHNSVYTVRAQGVRSTGGALVSGGTQSFFTVRDGDWSEPEQLAAGGDSFGGLTLTPDLAAYATIEGSRPLSGGTIWYESIIRSRFGLAWQFPEFIYARTAVGAEDGVELRTSGLTITNNIGFFRINEGDGNERNASTMEMIMRAPVGHVYPSTGLEFGPIVQVNSLTAADGRIDQPGPPEFAVGTPHFSFDGPFVAADSFIGTAFWGLSDAQNVAGLTGDRFVKQRVYVNDISMPPAPMDPSQVQWGDWGPAQQVSAPGVDHSSWPIVAREATGRAFALWWSATSTAGIFEPLVQRYWLSEFTPGTGWSTAVDVTPPGEVGQLPAITDAHVLDPVAGGPQSARVLVFSRLTTGPSARVLDLGTGLWSVPTSPVGSYNISQTPTNADYVALSGVNLNYKQLRGRIGRMTPKANPTGANEFLVNWVNVTNAGGPNQAASIVVSAYDANAASGVSPWGTTIVDLSAFASLDDNEPYRSNIALSVDVNGWATIVWREEDSSGLFQVMARRTNLAVSGPAGLADPMVATRQVSPVGFEVYFPALSNTHSSGAVSLGWNFGFGNGEILGAAVSRFQ